MNNFSYYFFRNLSTFFIPKFYFFWLISFILFSPIPTINAENLYKLSDIQYDSLYALYNSTAGDQWVWRGATYGYPWDFNPLNYSNPCNQTHRWQGLYCTSSCEFSPCDIEVIELSNHGLMGTLPPEIGNFPALKIFDIDHCEVKGTIPLTFYQLTSLEAIRLSYNALSGSISSLISNLISLQRIYLETNSLTGSLPKELALLPNLTYLELGYNKLSDSLPPELSQSPKLQYLVLEKNDFTGTIPSSFGAFQQLIQLELTANLLSGPIPGTLGNISTLRILNLPMNAFTGILPIELAQLTQLTDFVIYHTLISGTLPIEYQQLPSLTQFFVFENQITGTIPSNYSAITSLGYVSFATNYLTGSIPSSFSQCPFLDTLYLYQNYLTGSLSTELFGNLYNLRSLLLYSNFLTGTIPSELAQSRGFMELFLNSNYFIGSIPSTFVYLTSLYMVAFSKNQLTGKLEGLFDNNTAMEYIDVSYNQFTGSLPQFPLLSTMLEYVDFSSNQFHGTIPSSYQSLQHLGTFSISNNQITGTLPYIPSSHLRILYINNNSLSGSLPNIFMNYPYMFAFVGSINCFTGTLPESLCSMTYITQIILDGLHSSATCHSNIFSMLSSSGYIASQGVSGTIPSCLFQQSKLKIFHISGNNLSGKLPSLSTSIYPISNLSSLIVSNNLLSGTVPIQIWQSSIAYLDLSFNEFTSEIDKYSYTPMKPKENLTDNIQAFSEFLNTWFHNHTVYLQVNRFSGQIPSILSNQSYILNILEGNIFSCSINRNNLPSQDPKYDSYQCGSDLTNVSLYVWLGFFVLMLCIVCYFVIQGYLFTLNTFFQPFSELIQQLKLHSRTIKLSTTIPTLSQTQLTSHTSSQETILQTTFIPQIDRIKSIESTKSLESIELEQGINKQISISILPYFQQTLQIISYAYIHMYYILQWIVGFTICIILPCYVVFTSLNGVYSHEYVWILSSAYLQSTIFAIVLLILYIFLFIFILYELYHIQQQYSFTSIWGIHVFLTHCSPKQLTCLQSICHMDWFFYCKFTIFLLFDIIIVLLVNIAYVLAINHGYNHIQLTCIFVSITLFKLLWSNLYLLGIGRQMIQDWLQIPTISTITIVLLSIFNNIVAPYIAEAFVSSECFLYAIIKPPSISSHYYEFVCNPETICQATSCTTGIICPFQYGIFYPDEVITTTYTPPYHYYYTCSSSLLTSFGYIFIYRYLITGLCEPCMIGWLKWMQIHYEWFDGYFGQNKEFWLHWFTNGLPTLLKFECFYMNENHTVDHNEDHKKNNVENNIENNHKKKNILKLFPTNFTLQTLTHTLISSKITIQEKILVRLITDFALLLSFGVMFPPLILIILCSMIKDFYILWISLNKYIQFTQEITMNPNIDSETSMNISTINISQEMIYLLQNISQQLSQQFQIFLQILWQGIQWSVLVSGLFWSFTLFDILGNEVGAIHAIWIVIIMGLSIFWIQGLIDLYFYWLNKCDVMKKPSSSSQETNVQDQYTNNPINGIHSQTNIISLENNEEHNIIQRSSLLRDRETELSIRTSQNQETFLYSESNP